jgi:hypothetical protein
MSSVIEDLNGLGNKLKTIMQKILYCINVFAHLRKLFVRKEKPISNKVNPVKVGIIGKIKNSLTPRAKLTYWLADEEVVVYVTEFKQKDRFKLIYKEIETGRVVMVNSSNPINYRLEELTYKDSIEHTHVEQNQRY